jgi:ABC-type lipoprotein release transport system permease subunit
VLSGVLNASNITIADENVKIFLGGGNIGFILTLSSILGTLFAIVLGSSLANIYPVSLALRVTPLKAMKQE